MLQEFISLDGEKDVSLEKRAKARQEVGLTRRAQQIKNWPDHKKIDTFQKFELINIKTYKCRNKQNLSPIVNQEFDPNKVKADPCDLYEPRIQAYEAMEKHLNNIERASASWLHQKSIHALEGINRTNEDTANIKE